MNVRNHINTGVDFNLLLKPYLKNKVWFFVSVFLCVCLGLLYIRYTTPKYAAQAKIRILDEESSGPSLNPFKDLEVLTGSGEAKVMDEMEVFLSRSNMISVVKKLGLNIKIRALGNIRDSELYDKPPFNINFLTPDTLINSLDDVSFYLKPINNTSFLYGIESGEYGNSYSFGEKISSEVGEIIITPALDNLPKSYEKEYKVTVVPLSVMAEFYQNAITLVNSGDVSNIITVSLEDAIKSRGKDIINSLIERYNQNAVDDKKAVADRTANFINDRIADIYGNLSAVDQNAEDFKSGRGIADIAAQTNVNLNIGASNQQELQNATVQLDIASSMRDIVQSEEGYELLPANVGLSDATIANTTARYNDLALERKRLLESSNEKNPIIVNLDQQLDGLKRSMLSSLNGMENNLTLQVNSLSSQLSRINSKIYSAPKNERALRDISRQQQTTESLYLYLLQKREESQITFASASPKSKIIDDAYLVSEIPVSPKKSIILLASIVFGLLFPFSIIYVNEVLDNKIHNKNDLEKLTGDVPVLAELPKISSKEDTLIKTDERTVLAESLRILRTNLDYLLKSKSNSREFGNSIFVTSSVPGEGKTLVSFNLAMIYANAGKKVLLIGADIRNPKIYEFYSSKNVDKLAKSQTNKDNKGLTDFLSNRDLVPKQIISSILANNQTIDIVFAGNIPPNPTELLMNERVDELFEYVRQKYDYIIVDTAPLMVVSDTLLISGNADQTLYVTRAGITETSVVDFPVQLQKEGKLKGLSFIVNGVKSSNLGYGGKYGYGYGTNKKKWYQF
ncbi:GumC family protein [Croceitalea rosinachiae]|uniref:non-specific protein-tyrosine kinase n=1 Tax=Croceitalea rosinachiae TaxID=3075596 RepID=A0ABU3ACA6_9FLAO|nr:polysaccharide biosynthesis tyrosine autokinase [Croceitalea sp. F388]MDT0607824.1 polysaccharide biosynthesis tyrosine autokinase [Croceitalea sp. F388]